MAMRTVMVFQTWAVFWLTMIIFWVVFTDVFLSKANALFNVMLPFNCVTGVVVMLRHVFSKVGVGRRLAIITVLYAILWYTSQQTFVGRLGFHLDAPNSGYLPGSHGHCTMGNKPYKVDELACGCFNAFQSVMPSDEKTFRFIATFLTGFVGPLVAADLEVGSRKAKFCWAGGILSALTSQGLVLPLNLNDTERPLYDNRWWVILDAFRSFLLYASLRNIILPSVRHSPLLTDLVGIALPGIAVCYVLHPINPLFLFVISLWVDAEAPPREDKKKDGSKAAKDASTNTTFTYAPHYTYNPNITNIQNNIYGRVSFSATQNADDTSDGDDVTRRIRARSVRQRRLGY